MMNGSKDSTTRTSVVTFLGLLSVFESTSESGAKFRRQLILQVRIERSEFKDDIHVDDKPIEELQVNVMRGGRLSRCNQKFHDAF